MSKGGNNKLLLALLFLGGMATYLFKSKKKDTFSGIIPYDDFNKDDVSNLLRDYDIPDLEEGANYPDITYGEPQPPKSEGDVDGQVISINIANNTSSDMSLISILGNNQDTMDNSNATTQYGWNLTGFSITTEDTITLQYKGVNDSAFITTSIPLSGTTLQSIADALNTLNIGTFFIATSGGNTYLYNYNQNIVFGTLNITSSTVVGGSINTSFAVGTGFNNDSYAIAIQSDGKILVGGTFTTYQGTPANNIIRLTSTGAIDTSFVYLTGFNGNVNSIVIQSDGKILVGGQFTTYQGTPANRIIRLTSTGAIDGTFAYLSGFNDYITSIKVQSDGKILVGGNFTTYQGIGANRIIRLTSTGAIDGTFAYGSGFNVLVEYINIQTDGNILVVGLFSLYNGTGANGIIRLTTTGAIDTSFVYLNGFDNIFAYVVYTSYIQSDGNILVGGNFIAYNGTPASCIIRLTSTGAIDTSFVYGSGFNIYVTSIQVQSDGKILVGGLFNTYNGTGAGRIIRLNSNGSVDTSFVGASGFDSSVYCIALNSTQVYVGGQFTVYQGQSYPRIISLNQ